MRSDYTYRATDFADRDIAYLVDTYGANDLIEMMALTFDILDRVPGSVFQFGEKEKLPRISVGDVNIWLNFPSELHNYGQHLEGGRLVVELMNTPDRENRPMMVITNSVDIAARTALRLRETRQPEMVYRQVKTVNAFSGRSDMSQL